MTSKALSREEQLTMAVSGEVVIRETDDYALRTCVYPDQTFKEDMIAYGLFNKTTGVREGEFRHLPLAYEWLNTLQDRLEGGTDKVAALSEAAVEAAKETVAEAVAVIAETEDASTD